MSRYLVRVVGPAGCERYLSRGRIVDREQATRFPHPSNAWQAADKAKEGLGLVYMDVIDTRDPERVVS